MKFPTYMPQDVPRPCDWPGCTGHGEFRAPKSRDALRDYLWFCLEHIREYNANWDYFRGLPPEAVEVATRQQVLWERPLWPMGGQKAGNEWRLDLMEEELRKLGEEPPAGATTSSFSAPNGRRRASSRERDSLAQLDLDEDATLQEVKKRYKHLVKKYHPDTNRGSTNPAALQQKLRDIIQAYSHLMGSGLYKEAST